MLRALGVTRRQVLGLFLGEAAAARRSPARCSASASAALLADWAVGLTGATVSTLYIATAAAPPALTGAHVALALRGGRSAVAAGRGAAGASRRRRVPPTAAIRGSDRLESRVRLGARTLVAPAAGPGWLPSAWPRSGPVDGRPLFGYAAAFATIVGASLLVPVLLFGLARAVRRPLRRAARRRGPARARAPGRRPSPACRFRSPRWR